MEKSYEVIPSPDGKTQEVRIKIQSIELQRFTDFDSCAPLPHEFEQPIAHIAINWGLFEDFFKQLLDAMMRANSTEDRRALYHSFESKAERMLEELKCFDCYPWVSIYIKQIIADAKRLQLDRNLLLHGNIKLRAHVTNNNNTTPIEVTLTIVASGRRKKVDVVEVFDLEKLFNLSYGIRRLLGRISVFNSFPVTIPNLSWQDTLWLQAFLMTNHPHHATPPQQPPQRESSQQ